MIGIKKEIQRYILKNRGCTLQEVCFYLRINYPRFNYNQITDFIQEKINQYEKHFN